jgi:ABC-type multidrug transport system ATPase subunit
LTNLSGGETKRLNVFLALISKVKVLFMDEFSNDLDINKIYIYLDFIKK